jgi:iduronate 2-sulfatase
MRIVPNIKEDQADIPPAGLGSYKREQDNMTDDQRRDALQGYYASISFMDVQVGRVIAALDRLGLAESTIIVFTSDHGYHTGEHGLWQKQSVFEESARVPLLIVAPGVSKGKSVAASPVSHLDLFPTLTELAGVKPPANLQGQSLVPLLRDPSAVGRGWALTQVNRGPAAAAGKGKGKAAATKADAGGGRFSGYSLRTPRWRYTEWDAGKQGRELYDHETDPRELTNLATLPAHAATVATLSAQLQAAVKTTFPPSGKDRHPVTFLAGRNNLENPNAPINLIHQDDCIGIILKVLKVNFWNETLNAVAPFHPTREEYYTKKAIEFNIEPPIFNHSKPSIGKTIVSDLLENVLKYHFIKESL